MKHLVSFTILLIMLSLKGLQAQIPDPKFDDYLASVRELLPVDGTLLYDCSVMAGYQFYSHGANSLEVFDVEDDEMPFTQAWRAHITEVDEYWWSTGFGTPQNTIAIEEGDMLFWVYYARTNEVDDLIGLSKAIFGAGITEPPYTSIGHSPAYPQTGWTRFYFYTEAPSGFDPGDLHAIIQLGFFPQIIEFGGFIALNLGQGIDPADLPVNEAMIDPKFDDYLAAVRELLPVDGTLLFDCADLSGYNFYGNLPSNTFSMITVEDDELPFEKAYRLNTSNSTPDDFYSLHLPLNDVPVLQDEWAFFVFYARSVVAQQEAGFAIHFTASTADPIYI